VLGPTDSFHLRTEEEQVVATQRFNYGVGGGSMESFFYFL